MGAIAVWHVRLIGKEDGVSGGQPFAHTSEHGQPAQPRVEKANRPSPFDPLHFVSFHSLGVAALRVTLAQRY